MRVFFGKEVAEQILELDAHLLDALGPEDRHRRRSRLRRLEFDLALVEQSLAQHLAQLLARLAAGAPDAIRRHRAGFGVGAPRGGQQCVEDALFGALVRLGAHRAFLLLGEDLHREIGEIAHDRLDVAPDVADLGELRRFDLDERRLRQLREAARDLGLPHAGRPDHDDVLRRDLLAQIAGDLLAPPAIAQRDRDGALRLALADDVAIEFRDDLARREGAQVGHGSSTTWIWSLV